MTRPRLLDLFCGAGGAAMGYHRAGFDVFGVDIKPQPRYPFPFAQMDALAAFQIGFHTADGEHWHRGDFDAIHASPPCQGYSLMQNYGAPPQAKLIAPMLALLMPLSVPWVIENVVSNSARRELRAPSVVMICGASFGLGAAGLDLNRHRLFGSNELLMVPKCQHRRGLTIGVYGHGTNSWHRKKMGRNITMAERRSAMGIDWMRRGEDSEAIPPAYTEFIGGQLLRAIEQAA